MDIPRLFTVSMRENEKVRRFFNVLEEILGYEFLYSGIQSLKGGFPKVVLGSNLRLFLFHEFQKLAQQVAVKGGESATSIRF